MQIKYPTFNFECLGRNDTLEGQNLKTYPEENQNHPRLAPWGMTYNKVFSQFSNGTGNPNMQKRARSVCERDTNMNCFYLNKM